MENAMWFVLCVVSAALTAWCVYGTVKFGRERKGVLAILCGLLGYVSGLTSAVSAIRLVLPGALGG